jgi:hypothetical protein
VELHLSTPEKILGSKTKFYVIQDGCGAPIEIYKYCNEGKMVIPKWARFGTNHPPHYKTANINVKN